MKKTTQKDFIKKCHTDHKLYGTTTIGSRGQIVIPAGARKDLNIKTGDQFVVTGKFGKILGLIKTDDLDEFVAMIMQHVSDEDVKNNIRQEFDKMFNKMPKKKKS